MALELSARQTNRLRVIQALYRHPGSSRTTVAELTGLSRPTVSAFMEELERAGIVEELEDPTPRQSGRPPVLMSLVPQAAFAVGVDMGHEHLRVATCNLSGEILSDQWTAIDVDHAPRESMDLAAELVQATLAAADVAREHVIGVGMALAAPVDRTGRVFAEGILAAWGGVEPIAEMTSRLNLPVQLGNDANLGALGEHVFGAGQGVDEMVYVRLSAGIGLGFVFAGHAFGGSTGIAGELGHVRVSRDGQICRCGNRGCSGDGGQPERGRAPARRRTSRSRRLLELATSGDRGATRAVADAGELIGEALATVVTLLNPKLIVVGGELATTGDVVLDPIRAAIARHGIPPAANVVRVTRGQLGGHAEVLGAAALVLGQSPRVLAQRVD